jgi:thiol-disulfide isomerase/thioredoxin
MRSPLVILLTAALAGCTQPAAKPTDSPATPAAVSSPSADSLEIIPASAAELIAAAQAPGAKVTVMNIWATWCAPCREEFPDILKLEQTYRDRGMRLILVSADFDDQLGDVRRFLAQHEVRMPTYLKTGKDMEFIDGLNPKWSGALPATLVYDTQGKQVRFWEGRADYAKFEAAVLEVLDGATAAR